MEVTQKCVLIQKSYDCKILGFFTTSLSSSTEIRWKTEGGRLEGSRLVYGIDLRWCPRMKNEPVDVGLLDGSQTLVILNPCRCKVEQCRY